MPMSRSEIFNSPSGILAWGAIAHEVQVVPGGYRATGRWDFASGSRQASWLGAHVQVVEADGSRRRKPDGAPEIRTILFPVASATMYDVWDVIGLKGTGTDSYSVENLFVPEKFAALRDEPAAVRETGPLYRLTTNIVFGTGLRRDSRSASPAPRSMPPSNWRAARPQPALRRCAKTMRCRARSAAPKPICARRAPISMPRPARSGAIWRASGGYTEDHRAALRLASTWTIHQSASVVDAAYHMAGATAVFSANKFERRFRDMHAIAQQIQARDTHYEDVGRAILATDPGAPAMDA